MNNPRPAGEIAEPAEPAEPAEIVDGVIAALADPTRRQLLDLLSEQGEATATTLAHRLPVSRQAVVKHLAVLDAAGLVTGGRAGREVRYAVRPDALDVTARWMAARAAEWDRRLAHIKRVAEAAEPDRADPQRCSARKQIAEAIEKSQ